MEIIKPEDKQELKEKAVEGVGPQEEKPVSPLSVNFADDGVVTMRIDLKAAIASEDIFHMMCGFIDNTKERCKAHVIAVRAQMQKDREQIIRLQNKDNNRGFVSKLFKH